MTQRYLTGLLILALTLLAACSDSDADSEPIVSDPDEAATFEEQKITWEPCDPIFSAEFNELLEPVEDRLECATLITPLDWGRP